MSNVRRNPLAFAVGIDVYLPYLKLCKGGRTHNDFVLCHAAWLPFRSKSVDLALALEILEHLSKELGHSLVLEIERVSKKGVVLSTPVGLQVPSDPDRLVVKWQSHNSGWVPNELVRLGYSVVGQGLKAVHSNNGIKHRLPRYTKWLAFIPSCLLAPLCYRVPDLAAHMICAKSTPTNHA